MKTITVHFSEEMYDEIENHLLVCGMCGDIDFAASVLHRIIVAIEDDWKEVKVQFKKGVSNE